VRCPNQLWALEDIQLRDVRTGCSGEPRAADTEAFSITPLQKLHGIITPNGPVFERHHAGVPEIAPDQHRLS